MELVSVIVPSYNHEKFLEQRLESIFNQSYPAFEVIILDDCSRDNSRAIISKYRSHPKVASIVFNEKNSGSAFIQWKKGIALARGKYIWIAESDDYCDLNFLETAVSKMSQGYRLFYCRNINIDSEGTPRENQTRWFDDLIPGRWQADFENEGREEIREFLSLKNTINNASAVVFRNEPALQDYLGKVMSFRYCGDWVFWLQYLDAPGKLYYSCAVNNYFRFHSATTRSDHKIKRNAEMLEVLGHVLALQDNRAWRKKIALYFFEHHFYKGSRLELGINIPLFFRQIFVSPLFFPLWFSYYFSSRK